MRELIVKKSEENIGALCGFLKSPRNIQYLEFVINNIPSGTEDLTMSEKIKYFVDEIKDLQICDCGNHLSFIGFKNGWRPTCGKKICFVKRRKKTCTEKYGVDNPMKSDNIKSKAMETNVQKFGHTSPMQSQEIKDKFKKTMMETYGVEWPQESKEINAKSIRTWKNNPNKKSIVEERSEKIKNKSEEEKRDIQEKKHQTILNKWGQHYMNTAEIKEKIKNTYCKNYGVDSPFKNEEISKKRIKSYKHRKELIVKSILPSEYIYVNHGYNRNKTGIELTINHIKCGNEFKMNTGIFKNRLSKNQNLCLICNPVLHGKSEMENDLYNFIRENYSGEIIKNHRDLIKKEIDIYLPDLKIAFEFNGLYWHSEIYKDRYFHISKSKECLEKNILLVHIWEDDWIYKNEIIKSIILNKLGKSKRIYARNCEVKEVTDNGIVRDFLEKNHIQGFVGSETKIGLFLDDAMVSIMTFGKTRRSLGAKLSNDTELLRFCNLINHSVIGGASKLFKYFINNYNYNKIISYSDRSRYVGDMYLKLGFRSVGETDPNYYWVINDIRKHRFGFRKDKLIKMGFDPNKTESEIMNENGHYRIFDCGSMRWEFSNK